jgi:predicted transcriptional regulator
MCEWSCKITILITTIKDNKQQHQITNDADFVEKNKLQTASNTPELIRASSSRLKTTNQQTNQKQQQQQQQVTKKQTTKSFYLFLELIKADT